jgi:protoporphyrinogen oxidase
MSDGPIKAIIVGAGPAGLTAAYELAKAVSASSFSKATPTMGNELS